MIDMDLITNERDALSILRLTIQSIRLNHLMEIRLPLSAAPSSSLFIEKREGRGPIELDPSDGYQYIRRSFGHKDPKCRVWYAPHRERGGVSTVH